MEKVQITKEQADSIKSLRIEKDFDALVKKQFNGWETKRYRHLNEINLKDFCRILIDENSYEVIPEFKENDWIVATGSAAEEVPHPMKINHICKYYVRTNEFTELGNECFRHATPEEIQQEKKRRFWNRIGRKEDEYKQNDLVMYQENYALVVEGTENSFVEIYVFSRSTFGFSVTIHAPNLILVAKADDRLDM